MHPSPINLKEVGGFDVIGIPEVRSIRRGGYCFEISNVLTIADLINEAKNRKEFPEPYSISYRYLVADIKAKKIRETVERLRLLVCEEFKSQLKIISNYHSYFYIPKERIVQFISVPVSFIDLAPGDTRINFNVFTERFLGEIEDEK